MEGVKKLNLTTQTNVYCVKLSWNNFTYCIKKKKTIKKMKKTQHWESLHHKIGKKP